MSNSPLVSCTRLSPNCTKPRNHRIDTITIHHMAGQLSAETCGAVFSDPKRKASANYGVGSDGRIGLYVDEGCRSWASSNPANDHRAVTIEVANCGRGPDWPVSDKVYAALIELVADICKRNGIKKLMWSPNKSDRVGHKNGCNMTVHQDFAATLCPGPYLLKKMPDIARDVNAKLGAEFEPYTVRVAQSGLAIRKGPGSGYAVAGIIKPGVYTIVEEADGPGANRWGKLKSGAGWIALDRVVKLQ